MKQKSEQIKHDTTVGNSVERYTSPRTMLLFVTSQKVLCGSPYGENTEKFTLGDNNYNENDWE